VKNYSALAPDVHDVKEKDEKKTLEKEGLSRGGGEGFHLALKLQNRALYNQ
jgi:hypothetical protein